MVFNINFKAILNWLWPGETLKSYEIYFETCELIQSGGPRNAQLVYKIYLIIGILLLKSAHFLYMTLNVSMSDVDHLIHYDLFYFTVKRAALQANFIFFLIGIMSAAFYYIFYMQIGKHVNPLIRRILIQEDKSYFISSRYKRRKIVKALRKFASKMAKYLRFFLLFGDILAIVSRLNVSYKILQFYDKFFPTFTWGCIYLSINWISAILFAIFVLYFLNICLMILAVKIILYRIFYIKLYQIRRYLAHCFRHFSWVHFFRFQRYYTETLVGIMRSNQVYGSILFLHFGVNLVISVILLFSIILINQADAWLERSLLAFMFLQQLVGYALYHAIVARFNYRIQQPARLLFNLAVQKQNKMGDFTSRLALINYIFILNGPKSNLGITYGSMGPITLVTFAKFLFLYFIFAIFILNLLKIKYYQY